MKNNYKIYEPLNSWNKQKENFELLRDRLIYLSSVLPVAENDKAELIIQINKSWEATYDYFRKCKDNVYYGFNYFLENHTRMYFMNNFISMDSEDDHLDFLLNKYYIPENIHSQKDFYKIDYCKIKEYTISIEKSSKVWVSINNNEYPDFSEEASWLMKNCRHEPFVPLIMAIILKEVKEEVLIELLKACDRFSFLVHGLSEKPFHVLRKNFYWLAKRCYNEDTGKTGDRNLINIIFDGICEIKNYTDEVDNEGIPVGWFNIDIFYSEMNIRNRNGLGLASKLESLGVFEEYKRYFNGSYSEIKVTKFNEWNKNQIIQSGTKILEFMEKRWNIKLPDKEKLLGMGITNKPIKQIQV